MKKWKGLITPTELFFLVQRFEETGSWCDPSHRDAPHLWEARRYVVASQIGTLSKQFRIGISSARQVQRIPGIPKTF